MIDERIPYQRKLGMSMDTFRKEQLEAGFQKGVEKGLEQGPNRDSKCLEQGLEQGLLNKDSSVVSIGIGTM